MMVILSLARPSMLFGSTAAFLAMSTTPQKPVLTEAAALPVELLTALVALLVLVLAASPASQIL